MILFCSSLLFWILCAIMSFMLERGFDLINFPFSKQPMENLFIMFIFFVGPFALISSISCGINRKNLKKAFLANWKRWRHDHPTKAEWVLRKFES